MAWASPVPTSHVASGKANLFDLLSSVHFVHAFSVMITIRICSPPPPPAFYLAGEGFPSCSDSRVARI